MSRRWPTTRSATRNSPRSCRRVESAADGKGELQGALASLGEFMAKYANEKTHTPTDPNNLPWGSPKPVTRAPYTSPAQFKTSRLFGEPVKVAQAGSLSGIGLPNTILPLTPTPADTAPTEDVQITQAIRDLATSLTNNPVKIYNWVRNNIAFIPSYGSIQGSDMTLQTKRGNAFDTASLLIALLRAANVPARYVYGTIDVPVDKAMNWVGGVTVPQAAMNLMGQGGIPNVGVASGGQLKSIRLEHVWVEAFVDYVPSRGAVNRNPNTWVPLDASFKQYQFTQGMDLNTAIPFDANSLIAQAQQGAIVNETEGWVQNINQTAVQQALLNDQSRVTNYINAQKPNATVGDVIGTQTIVAESRPILLGTLPYTSLVIGAKFQSIPDRLRHKLTMKLYTSELDRADESPALVYTAGIPALASKRVSFTYQTATAADQAVIDSAIVGNRNTFPAYLVHYAPMVKVEDAVVASAGAFATGESHILTVTLNGPWEDRSRDYRVQAGDFWVVGLNPAGITQELFQARTQQHNLVENPEPNVAAEMFHQIALGWWGEKYSLNSVLAATHDVVQYQMPSHTLAGTPISVRYFFGVPRSASYKSRVMDAKEDTVIALSKGADANKRRMFVRAAGQMGSYLEAGIFDQGFLMPAGQSMSSMTALKVTADSGRRIYTITQSNAFALGQIQTDPSDLQDMQNAVASGLTVTTAQSDITVAGFTGLGYILEDPQTGAAAYLISGGRNGVDAPAPGESVFPLPEIQANGAASLMIGMSVRSAGGSLVMKASLTGARAAAGIAIGGGLSGFLAILGILLVILLLLAIIVIALDTLYPPTTERVRHYTRQFDRFLRNPDGSHTDPNVAPKDIIEIEKYLIGGIFEASLESATFGAGVYFVDRTDSVPPVGSQILFSCPPTPTESVAVVSAYGIFPRPGETAIERISAYVDITFTREKWPPRTSNRNANNLTEIVVTMPYFFYIRNGSYFGVTHEDTCRLF